MIGVSHVILSGMQPSRPALWLHEPGPPIFLRAAVNRSHQIPLLFIFLLVLDAISALAEPNLLPQGSFQNPGANTEWADGFNIPQNEEFKVVSEEGKSWLRIENHDASRQLDYVHAYVKVTPEMESLTISARLKATHLKTGTEGWHDARIAMSFEGGSFAYPSEVPELAADSDWVTKSVKLKVPKGASRLNLQPAMFHCTGVFEVAELTVTPELKEPPRDKTENEDAKLPAGTNLDWEKGTVVQVNEKRSTINLDGIWRFMPAQDGVAEPPKAGWAYIKVPGSWQSAQGRPSDFVARASGPMWQLFDGSRVARAWYERQATIPSEWKGRSISLRFDRVSTDAIVYANGKECGKIQWPWGSVDITSAVTPGQTATIRVLVAAIADADAVGTFWQNALSSEISFSSATLRSRGLTGNVDLEGRVSEAQISDVFVRPSTRHKNISFDVELAGVKKSERIDCVAEILNEKGEVEKTFNGTAMVEPKLDQTISFTWPWENPKLWDIGQPNLYTARLTITGAGVDDQYDQTFGFREFWIEGRQFYLNGTVAHLRQPCFYNGTRGQVGDNFSEMGSENVDARGDTSDSTRSLSEADHKGYLVAHYVLNANKYLMNSRRQIGWEQNKERALNRAEVWMRHYRNHPSIIMWIAGFNFFNNAVDADPRHIGRKDWGIDNERWQHLMALGKDMFEKLRALDPTRVYYSHAGAYTGDVYTMNCYLDLLPLQEREDWLTEWAQKGEMPVAMVEFGTPMDCSYRRGRHGFESNITSEPLLTEYAAIYFGSDAYSVEEPKYRQYLHDLFRGGMLYASSENHLDEFTNNHKIQQLYRMNTWRSWRTAGLSGGLRTWSWMQDALKEVNGPTLAWIAGPPGDYTAKEHNFSPGQTISKQIVLINDARQSQKFQANWTASVGGKQIAQDHFEGSIAPSEIRSVPFQVNLPDNLLDSKTAAAEGEIRLSSSIGDSTQTDKFPFRIIRKEKSIQVSVGLVDPSGRTRKMLEQLGFETQPWEGGATPLLVIGRNGLKERPTLAAQLEDFVGNGGRALLFAQDPDWLWQSLGFRVCPKVSRRVFPILSAVKDSSFESLNADDFRDWSGSSTLIEPFPEYSGNYFRGNEREQPYAGWHWGNRGGVASAAIEKPHRSGWRPLLECEFDLAYSPLMELDYGKGRLIFCTLDLEDHAAIDPAAHRAAQRLIDYALHAPLSPVANKVIYLGGGAGAAWLNRIGVTFDRAGSLNDHADVTLIGSDAHIDSDAFSKYLENGGKAFVLPRSDSNDFFGIKWKAAPEKFAGSLSAPNWPESRGLSASDLRSRTFLDKPLPLLSAGAEIGADGLLGRKKIGKGVAIFCQIDPDHLSADEKTYLRYTRWRATRAVAQLLANLGCSFSVDQRIFHPFNDWEANLDGTWQMQMTLKLPAAKSEAAAVPDPGISEAAKKLIKEDASNTGWASINLPQMLPLLNESDGEVILKKEIQIPAEIAGKDMQLSLGSILGSDITYFNGVEIGRSDSTNAPNKQLEVRYLLHGNLVRAGTNTIVVRLFNRFGPSGFLGKPGFFMGPNGDKSGPQATGPRLGLEMSLTLLPQGPQALSYYHSDYRTDFQMGDNPYRYYRW